MFNSNLQRYPQKNNKGRVPRTYLRMQTMLDLCSSDNWILSDIAIKLGAKRVEQFKGVLKTISGVKRVILPKYPLKILRNDRNYSICLSVSEIGWKPAIVTCCFHWLLTSFSVKQTQVDNGWGEIGLLLGLQCQALQAFRVNTFQSKQFPGVGLYASLVLDGKIIFLGSDNSNRHSEPSATFLVSTTDFKMRKFLEAEECINIHDLQCEEYTTNKGCKNCKNCETHYRGEG